MEKVYWWERLACLDEGESLDEGFCVAVIEEEEGFDISKVRILLFGKLDEEVWDKERLALTAGKCWSLLFFFALIFIEAHWLRASDLGTNPWLWPAGQGLEGLSPDMLIEISGSI